MKLTHSVGALIALAGLPLAASAGIVNGSFEDHDPLVNDNGNGFWNSFASIPGWYAESDVIEIGQGTVYGISGYDQDDVLELDANNNAKVSQDINLSAGLYTVSFLSALRSGVDAASCTFDVYWNDNWVGSYAPASTAMSMDSVNVSALNGMNKLSFVGTGWNDSYGALVDDVNIEAVPEPATLTALALGAAAMLRRRKKA